MNYNSGFSCPEVQNPAFIEHQCQPTWNMSAPVPPAPPQDPPPPHAQHLGASKLSVPLQHQKFVPHVRTFWLYLGPSERCL
ncbi:hypothetical protein XENTR_v10000723 [Xenopus tropicalis]|nr:hypothetical protein XENTR_v10000723 [Xenopus tropicalis]